MSMTSLIGGIVAAVVLAVTDANGAMFLGSRSNHMGGTGMNGGISDLLQELENVAGRDQRVATEQRVERLEGALRPMFDALPKDSSGRLGFDGVRYVLHRLFVQRHGWFVNGLDTAGDAWNSSSPTGIFKQHAGDDVHGLFEEKLASSGYDLHHTAVLAATLESLVHADCIERLRTAYRMLGFSVDGQMSEKEANAIIKAYMVMYTQGVNHSTVKPQEFMEVQADILTYYPAFPDTQLFAHEVRQSVLADVTGSERTSWESTLRVLEEIGEHYGRWQDKECRVMKNTLVKMETPGSGRVPLDKFYAPRLQNPDWQFFESVPYLEQLGALDSADPEHMSVIISNYVNAPSNCVASSKFYSVCCVDECDSLLSTLEGRIAAPEAPPSLIAQLIAGLPSDTISAPRTLPTSLVQRLGEIASHHGGKVPLHGRLFAQWMHHAYPRECAYPHLSGTTKPATYEEYMEQTGKDVVITKREMQNVISKASSKKTTQS